MLVLFACGALTSAALAPTARTPRAAMFVEPGVRRRTLYLENESCDGDWVLTTHRRNYAKRVLIMVCGVTESDAQSIVEEASDNWVAKIGTWEEALAQHIHDGMQKAGLLSTLVDEHEDPRPRYLDGTFIESDCDMPHWYQ